VAETEQDYDSPEDWPDSLDARTEDQLSIAHRLGSWKTIVSFAFAALVILFVAPMMKRSMRCPCVALQRSSTSRGS
jgi:hypothetical protein